MARAGTATLTPGMAGVGRRREVYPRERAVQDPSRLGSGWEGGVLLFLAAGLVSLGFVMVYSASAVMAQAQGLAPHHFLLRQMSGGLAGLMALALTARLDYRRLRPLSWPLLAGVVLMLTLLVLPGTESMAPRVNGARRWLYIGGMGFQPSELAKLVLII
ncbi:MAG TPA: FtsW/RodA/SpoVE family cell cycle protein, partial [Longimicrobiales bacterium]|nr:FtsW/RodA/SpoVE family cell cycle protein [Longimicrobiales bacterium]